MNKQVGLIGLGNWGLKIFKTIKRYFPKQEITCVAVKKGKNIKYLDKKIKIYNKWKKMINENTFESIFVAVPPKNNLKIFKEVLKFNIPLFLEKPMTTNLINAKKMFKLVKNKNLVIHINFIDLYNSAIIYLNKKSKNFNKIEFQITNSLKKKKYISPFEDLAPHAIALCLIFFKKFPNEIIAKKIPVDKNLKQKRNRELTYLRLIFPQKKIAEITVGNGTKDKIRKGKFFSNNKIYFFNDNAKNKLYSLDSKKRLKKNISIKNNSPLKSSIEAFIHRKNKQGFKQVELALNVQKIISYSLKSLNDNKKIAI